MQIQLKISPQAESALCEFVRAQGCSIAAVVSAIIEDTFASAAARGERTGEPDVDAALDVSDWAVLVDLLGTEFAECVAPGVLPAGASPPSLPCPPWAQLFPK